MKVRGLDPHVRRILQVLGARLQVLGVILLLIAARRPILSP
jgi:hypothetical protein